MAAMTLPKGSILSLATLIEYPTFHALSEHNRTEVRMSTNRIEQSDRMYNGTLRKWWIADKRTWSTSWDMLPESATYTVDGKWGGLEMEAFYFANPDNCWMQIRLPDGTTSNVNVVISSFEKGIQKRGRFEFWSVSLELEEV